MISTGEKWECGEKRRARSRKFITANPGENTHRNRTYRNRQDQAKFEALAAQYPEIAALVLTKPEGA